MTSSNFSSVLVLFVILIITQMEALAQKSKTETITVPDPEQHPISNKTDDIHRLPELPRPKGNL